LYVNARHILVETEEQAQDVLAALQSGESFAALAQSVSTDTSSGARGGELDWSPVSRYVEEFSDAVRDAAIGAYIGPVQSDFGYHIIQVRAREERELSETELETERSSVLQSFIDDLREADTTDVQIFEAWTENVPDEPGVNDIAF
jgi:parvulin-like peptidyl-prolyl isomerase